MPSPFLSIWCWWRAQEGVDSYFYRCDLLIIIYICIPIETSPYIYKHAYTAQIDCFYLQKRPSWIWEKMFHCGGGSRTFIESMVKLGFIVEWNWCKTQLSLLWKLISTKGNVQTFLFSSTLCVCFIKTVFVMWL